MTKAPQTTEAPESRGELELFLIALVQARRCLQIYPRTNRLVSEALAKLELTLTPDKGASGGAEDTLRVCEVRSDGFYLEGSRLCDSRSDVSRFALLLYREGAKLMRFKEGVSIDDCIDFIQATNDLEQSKEKKPARYRLKHPQVGLEFFDEAIVAQRSALPDAPEELNVMTYFLAQRQGRGATGKEEVSHLKDLLDFLIAAERRQEMEEALLLDTLCTPDKFAHFVSYAVHGDAEPGTDSGPRGEQALRQTFSHVENCMSEYPKELRQSILKSMSEAVLTTDATTRDCILNAVLPPGIGQGGLEDEITSYLPPRTASGVLLRHIQVHEGTTTTIQSFVQTLPDKKRRRLLDNFFEGLQNMPSYALPQQKHDSLRILLPQSRPAPGAQPAPTPSAEEIEARRKVLQAYSELALSITPDEGSTIRSQVSSANAKKDLQQDALTFFYLYVLNELPKEDRMLEMLQETLVNAMDDADFDFVNHVIQLALGNIRTDVRQDAFPTLQAYLVNLYGKDGMAAFIKHLTGIANMDPNSGTVQGALAALAGDATPALFHRLESEEAKQRRFELLNLLLGLGPVAGAFLRAQVSHSQWFVVRNAVYLMSRLPDPANAPFLQRALAHRDARVRAEALRGMANTPSEDKGHYIAHCLEDEELSIRIQAADILGLLGDPAWAGAVAEQLEKGGWGLRRHPDYGLSLLRALGEIGVPESKRAIRRYLRRCLLPGTMHRLQIRAMGRFTLRQIASRELQETAQPEADAATGNTG